jgi:hypothetical protein
MTVVVPCGSAHELQPPLSMESELAVPPATCQVKVTGVDCPVIIVLGEAFRVSVKGTVTVTLCGTAAPPGPEALIVKVVVEMIGTTADPEVDSAPVSSVPGTGGVIVTDVALLVLQVMVVVWPPFSAVGFAVKFTIWGGTGSTTCTTAVCGELLPPGPVATAVYVVVCVGESFQVPAACELVVKVCAPPEPVEAVMVMVVALVAFQLSVTLCGGVIVLLLAEKIKVGVAGGLLGAGLPLAPPQAQRPKRAQIKPPKPILRKNFSFILPSPYFASRVQMQCC